MDLFPGALRGMGYSAVPMVLSVIGTVGTRIVWVFEFSEPQIFIRTFCILSGVMDHYHCTSGRALLFCEKKGTLRKKKDCYKTERNCENRQ